MDDDCACDYRGFSAAKIFFCERRPGIRECGGDINKRPDWCPITELRVAMQHDVDNKVCWVEK